MLLWPFLVNLFILIRISLFYISYGPQKSIGQRNALVTCKCSRQNAIDVIWAELERAITTNFIELVHRIRLFQNFSSFSDTLLIILDPVRLENRLVGLVVVKNFSLVEGSFGHDLICCFHQLLVFCGGKSYIRSPLDVLLAIIHWN